MTRKMISRFDEDHLRRADENLVDQMLLEMQHTLDRVGTFVWTDEVMQALRKVFNSGLEFFRLLLRQQARYKIEMLSAKCNDRQARLFDPAAMTDVNNEEEEQLHGCAIEMSLFPIIYKCGDEDGDNVSMPRPPLLLHR